MGICLRSPTYADEIRTPEGGFRLHDFAREPTGSIDFLSMTMIHTRSLGRAIFWWEF